MRGASARLPISKPRTRDGQLADLVERLSGDLRRLEADVELQRELIASRSADGEPEDRPDSIDGTLRRAVTALRQALVELGKLRDEGEQVPRDRALAGSRPDGDQARRRSISPE